MKTYTITFNLKQITIGLALVFSAFTIYSFTSVSEVANKSEIFDQGITIDQAKTLYQANANSPSPYGGNLKAVTISKDMLDALEVVERKVNNPAGYRCYFAKNESGQKVSVMVAVDGSGNDIVTFIKSASASNFEGCPPICDANSPITN